MSNRSVYILLAMAVLVSAFFYYISKNKPFNKVDTSPEEQQHTTLPEYDMPDTSDWETYKAPGNVYSFKYPKDFTKTEYTEGNYKGIAIRYIGPLQERPQSELVDGVVIKTLLIDDTGLTAKEYAEQQRTAELNQPDIEVSITEISTPNFNGHIAYFYTVHGMGDAKVYYFDTEKGILQVTGLYSAFSTETEAEYVKRIYDSLMTLSFQ